MDMKIKVSKTKEIAKEKTSKLGTELEVENKKWFEAEGQLAVDIFQTDKDFYIQAAVAGVKPENLDISLENDMITIRGKRERLKEFDLPEKDYFYQECYWGLFSRQIILPAPINASRIEATVKEGILTIKLPKVKKEETRKVKIKS